MYSKPITASTLAVFGVSLLLLLPQQAVSKGSAHYKVTISNLTAGQAFTPPVLITHNKRTGIFTLGEEASAEVRAIAENGDNGPLVNLASGDVNVRDVVHGGMIPIVPANSAGSAMFDSSASFTISTYGNARYLSIISMLICTNDGFMGIDSVKLPSKKRTVYAVSYDARTELNTEVYADMVPPCQGLIAGVTPVGGTGASNPELAEGGFIIPHAGINGGFDLSPAVHNWGDPVAKIVIERVHHDDDDDSDSDSD